jgi:hypothetical protein
MTSSKTNTQTKSPRIQRTPTAPKEKDVQKELDALLKEAMKHPGVSDVIKVYEASADAEQSFGYYQSFRDPFPEMSTSASCKPVLC